jgi:hypothetical protein
LPTQKQEKIVDIETTMYPKNAETKAAWKTAALKKGYTILEA